MQNVRPAKITSPIITLKDDYIRIVPIALVVGVAGIALAFFGSGLSFSRFSFAYLTAFMFVLTICLGCLFFVTVVHLTRAGWCVTVRRVAELFAMCIVPLLILFLPILIPVLFHSDMVYSWNAEGWSISGTEAEKQAVIDESVYAPPIEELKIAYLNRGFFGIRTVIYFSIWGFMAWFFFSNSRKQDETGDKTLTQRMQAFSAPAMIVFAATLVFSSFDYEMSLEPLWFSTMFPVYFFAGSTLSAFAAISLVCMLLQRSGRVTDEITVDHYHDLAKLMFSFVFFWGYIAFGQFLLIWYANIPEETFWFGWRINESGWMTLSIILLFGHLLIPFLAIMARSVRRNKTYMFYASIYILVMHYVDHYWLIMPQAYPDHSFHPNVLADLGCAVGVIGLFVAIFCLVAKTAPWFR